MSSHTTAVPQANLTTTESRLDSDPDDSRSESTITPSRHPSRIITTTTTSTHHATHSHSRSHSRSLTNGLNGYESTSALVLTQDSPSSDEEAALLLDHERYDGEDEDDDDDEIAEGENGAEDPTSFEFDFSSSDSDDSGEFRDNRGGHPYAIHDGSSSNGSGIGGYREDGAGGGAEAHLLSRVQTSSVPPLPSTTTFLYLLNPLIKLGAILLVSRGRQQFQARPSTTSTLTLNSTLSPPTIITTTAHASISEIVSSPSSPLVEVQKPWYWGLSWLLAYAFIAGTTRHMWFMLARYVRRAEMEEVLVQTFARGRGRGKELIRSGIRKGVRGCVGVFRVLVAVVYLRVATTLLLPHFPTIPLIPARIPVTLFFSILVFPICFSRRSLAGASVIYATWTSVFTFVIWVACMAYAHAKGIKVENEIIGEELGWLFQGSTLYAFTFATSNTLPLYAALRANIQYRNIGLLGGNTRNGVNGTSAIASSSSRVGGGGGKSTSKRSRTFEKLSILSMLVAVGLTLPLVFFGDVTSNGDARVGDLPPSTQDPSLTLTKTTRPFLTFLALLQSLTLTLSLPSIIITTPSLPLPSFLLPFLTRRHSSSSSSSERFNAARMSKVSRTIVGLIVVGLAMGLDMNNMRVVSGLVMGLGFGSAYIVPPFVHIMIHTFRRPLSIVMPSSHTPSTTSQRPSPHTPNDPHSPFTPYSPITSTTSPHTTSTRRIPTNGTNADSRHDPLLQRKERSMQKKRLGKRLVWDLVAWCLVPLGLIQLVGMVRGPGAGVGAGWKGVGFGL